MASNRIIIDRTKTLGSKIADMITFGALYRGKLQEIALILGSQGYNGDASLQTDLGISAADQTRFQNLVANSILELNGLAAVNVPVGGVSQNRQLLDAIGIGG